MELIAVIKKIDPIQTFKSNFEKQEFLIVTEERFPQTLKIEVHSLHIDILDQFNPGDRVLIRIKILGKECIGKDGSVRYYNMIVANKIVLH